MHPINRAILLKSVNKLGYALGLLAKSLALIEATSGVSADELRLRAEYLRQALYKYLWGVSPDFRRDAMSGEVDDLLKDLGINVKEG